MPQANITYDAPYNRSMVKFIEELDKKHWEKAYPAYHPNPMGFRLGTFHGEPVSEVKVGGGSSPEKYLRSGNSPAYPPHNMNAGMAVSSGGARFSGVDGAVGGKGYNPFDLGYKFGHDVLGPAIFGKGRRKSKAVPKVPEKDFGPLKGGRKKKFDFLGAVKSVGHALGEPLAFVPEMVLKDAVKSSMGAGRKKAVAPSASRGRSVRADIVKKVMKEHGMKMIEASKYVKAHGLY